MYGMEEDIVRQRHRKLYEEVREARLARLARTGGPSRIGVLLSYALHLDHAQEKEA